MGKWIVVSLVAACSQSEPPTSPPTPTIVPAVTPTVAPAPAPDPCSAAELAKRGTLSTPVGLNYCGIKGIDEYVSIESIAKVVGRPLTRDRRLEKGDTTFEVTNRERLDQVLRCSEPPKLDWRTQRVWITIETGIGVTQSVGQIDDGKTLTLVVRNTSRSGCGGIKTGMSYRSNAVVVPADRKVEFLYCAIPNNCTGLEK